MKRVTAQDCAILQSAISTAIEKENAALAQLDSIPSNLKSPEVKTSIRERQDLLKDYDRLRDQLSDDSYGYQRSFRNRSR